MHVIAHEYIHVQQMPALVDDEHPTVLEDSLIEGGAEFMGKLISGEVAYSELEASTKGREKEDGSSLSRTESTSAGTRKENRGQRCSDFRSANCQLLPTGQWSPGRKTKMIMKAELQRLKARVFGRLVFVLAIGCSPALSQTTKPVMADIAPYLMERSEEISLARSAAPELISRDADVLVLGPHVYETAVKGNNGFVCEVDRSWTSGFTDPEFMCTDVREPICFNAVAKRSMLPWTFKRLALAMGGASKDEMVAQMKSAYAKKEVPNLGETRGEAHPQKEG